MCPRGRPRGQGRPRGLHLCQHRLPTSALCISANTGPTLDASPRPTLVDKIFLNYRQFFVINLGCSFQNC